MAETIDFGAHWRERLTVGAPAAMARSKTGDDRIQEIIAELRSAPNVTYGDYQRRQLKLVADVLEGWVAEP